MVELQWKKDTLYSKIRWKLCALQRILLLTNQRFKMHRWHGNFISIWEARKILFGLVPLHPDLIVINLIHPPFFIVTKICHWLYSLYHPVHNNTCTQWPCQAGVPSLHPVKEWSFSTASVQVVARCYEEIYTHLHILALRME